MVEFLYEYQGTQYIHWAAVAAVVVVLVYYIKQYYCAEGNAAGPPSGIQSVYTGAAGVGATINEQVNLQGGVSGRDDDLPGAVAMHGVPEFTGRQGQDPLNGFLGGREPPVILPYPALGPHQYMKAVYDTVKKGGASQVAGSSGFYEGFPSQVSQQIDSATLADLL